MLIKLRRHQKIIFNNSDKVFSLVRNYMLHTNKVDRLKEHFFTIGLKANNAVRFFDLTSLGNLRSTVASPHEIIRTALIIGNVNGIIIAHNHPSGNLQPSKADYLLTQKLKDAAALFEIKLLDSIVFSFKGYYSFADNHEL